MCLGSSYWVTQVLNKLNNCLDGLLHLVQCILVLFTCSILDGLLHCVQCILVLFTCSILDGLLHLVQCILVLLLHLFHQLLIHSPVQLLQQGIHYSAEILTFATWDNFNQYQEVLKGIVLRLIFKHLKFLGFLKGLKNLKCKFYLKVHAWQECF